MVNIKFLTPEKRYPFTKLGYTKMMYERNRESRDKFSMTGYYTILLILLLLGLLSREFVIAIVANAGISKFAYCVIK